jgi:hypothetical protein
MKWGIAATLLPRWRSPRIERHDLRVPLEPFDKDTDLSLPAVGTTVKG